MEIQGLSGAPNIHSQHGAPHTTSLSQLISNTHTILRSLSKENGSDGLADPDQSHQDSPSSRPGTPPLRPLAEHGSVARFSVGKQRPNGEDPPQSDATVTDTVLNVKETDLLSQKHVRSVWKHDVEGRDVAIQMAFPFFEGEEEQRPRGGEEQRLRGGEMHSQLLQSAGSRQQRAGGSALQRTAPGSLDASLPHRATEEPRVVFSLVQEEGRPGRHELFPTDEAINGKECSTMNPYHSTDVETTNVLYPNDHFHYVHGKACMKAECVDSLFNALTADGKATAFRQSDQVGPEREEVKVGPERIDGKLLGPLISENLVVMNTSENMDTSDFISDPSGLEENNSADTASTSCPANETFSGTIMINNQSIIVTIENGILTLAAPPEGYVHTDDDMVSLKEHLGMKDHEDIVLLNYDSGTKSIGKISTLAVASSSQHEPRAGLPVADSELALVDDCPLTEFSLDSCPIIKQEVGTLCAITESDLVTPCSKNASTLDCDSNHELQSVHFIRSKKETTISFGCTQPGCPSIFDTRQKLKIHLLNHAEDPRPYRCTVEGCGWAFTTSYKLKRHLQSHDKQRPHTCQFEGCGRRFTTVYNLKAHLKVHAQQNAFACQVCSECFRSATRLTNHQRAHFEPQRPHKCDFPGCEKTFITFSALFSHNRTHFREAGHFTCSYPGCGKLYDKACRLKIHLRSHTGERPFVCDSEGCGWSFTSMSKLLRHKRKHDDDRRFTCQEEGCGKSFTRAEHLKGHSITHLGTKPFQCHAEGCNAKFSARSSLYIHSKKHKQDPGALRSRCPVADCSKHFSSRSSLKSHMVKHHHLTADVLSQMEATPTLTPSSELVSSTPTTVAGPCVPGSDPLSNLDLSSLFSSVPRVPSPPAGLGVGVASVGGGMAVAFSTADFSLVSSGILTIDPSSVTSALGPHHHQADPTHHHQADPTHHHQADPNHHHHQADPTHHHQADLNHHPQTSPSNHHHHQTDPSHHHQESPIQHHQAGPNQHHQIVPNNLHQTASNHHHQTSPNHQHHQAGPTHHQAGPDHLHQTGPSHPLAGGPIKTVDPLILADMASHHSQGLEGTVGHVLPPQGTLNLDDVQSVTPAALGALSMQTADTAMAAEHGLSPPLAASSVLSGGPPPASLPPAPGPDLLAQSPSKVALARGQGPVGPLLDCVEGRGPQEGGGKGLGQFVFPGPSSGFSPLNPETSPAVSPSSFLESGGSARTDYRAIQLAKKKKQKGPPASSSSGLSQRKNKVGKAGSASTSLVPSSGRYGDGAHTAASGGLTLRDPVTGAQYVQIQLLQDDPPSDGHLAFQLSSQPSSSHSQLTVDLPVNILQESSVMPEDGSDTSQFTGSTINLQDLE
ncbi:uncharacterized protein si:dkey-156n14.3 isoform X1 [Gadus morhua]|uniref:C2H2-type domain-containing protein n=1 Tax=Gadus morhua TaxID=8049 RepID=A0A8C5BUU6_GADMO|nr:uncharacterized protein LOC115556834 isoform X1 [Gadus morhua]